ncbi:group II intron maturase-specific domain-containing protein [Parasutterella sp.]|uniref:group II intron maturase-specific domain-containing protein n=1 Tax=Parasutterella sp. TaxID=2049037 RepID=UPI003522B68A
MKRELKLILRGWVNYFYKAIPAKWVERTDQWLHRRVRQIYWKQWKRPAKRREEFKRRWKNAPALHEYAYSSNRYWRMSKGVQIHMALSLNILLKEGWYDLGKAMREASRRPA